MLSTHILSLVPQLPVTFTFSDNFFNVGRSNNGCETWSLTLQEERRLRVFENMVLRRIFGPRRDEVTGEWRRLHNEEINVLYSHPISCG